MGECKCLWYDGSVAIVYKNDMISRTRILLHRLVVVIIGIVKCVLVYPSHLFRPLSHPRFWYTGFRHTAKQGMIPLRTIFLSSSQASFIQFRVLKEGRGGRYMSAFMIDSLCRVSLSNSCTPSNRVFGRNAAQNKCCRTVEF
jgi:hypothetical protein